MGRPNGCAFGSLANPKSPPGATCNTPAAFSSGTVTGVAFTTAAMICGSVTARRTASASALSSVPRSSELKFTSSDPARPPASASASFSPVDEVAVAPDGVGHQRVHGDRAAQHLAATGDTALVRPAAAGEDEGHKKNEGCDAHGVAP